MKDGRNKWNKEKYQDEGVLLQIFSCVIMGSRKIWATKKDTDKVLVTISGHNLKLICTGKPLN
jgi:hypothetical protein